MTLLVGILSNSGPMTTIRPTKRSKMWPLKARLKSYSLQGWIRYLRLIFQGKKVVVVGSCIMCGKCCHRISLEAGGRWLRDEKDFFRVVDRAPAYDRFKIVGKDEQGFLLFTCSWFTKAGLCRDHEQRLDICTDYPNVNLYFTGGRLIEGCGYAFKEVVPFEKVLEKQLSCKNVRKEKTSGH